MQGYLYSQIGSRKNWGTYHRRRIHLRPRLRRHLPHLQFLQVNVRRYHYRKQVHAITFSKRDIVTDTNREKKNEKYREKEEETC